MKPVILVIAASCALAACASRGQTATYDPKTSASVCLLSPFSRDGSGSVSRADMEAGIRAGFAAADGDGNGYLDADELGRLNAARASSCDTTSLIDWSGTGRLGLDAYAARYRTAFDQADVNADSVATAEEIVSSRRAAPKAKRKPSEQEVQPTPHDDYPGQRTPNTPY